MFIDEALKESAILEATKKATIVRSTTSNSISAIVAALIGQFTYPNYPVDQLYIHPATLTKIAKARLETIHSISEEGATLRKIVFSADDTGLFYGVPMTKTKHVEEGYIYALNKDLLEIAACGSYKFTCLHPERILAMKYE